MGWLLGGILLVWIVVAVRWTRRHKGCGGGCAGCPHRGGCGRADGREDPRNPADPL